MPKLDCITDADAALHYLREWADAQLDHLARREVGAMQPYAAGHRDGAEQELHQLRHEVDHLISLRAAARRGLIRPLSALPDIAGA